MMTRRAVMIALAGMLVGVVATGVGTASAQATQSGLQQKATKAVTSAQTKWESLTPEQQQAYIADGKMAQAEAKAKWDTLTPEQQAAYKDKAVTAGKAKSQKAKGKWQALPK